VGKGKKNRFLGGDCWRDKDLFKQTQALNWARAFNYPLRLPVPVVDQHG
jgi:hypothetical protein